MNVLDEHIPPEQRELLTSWHIAVRQIGHDLEKSGMKDDRIILLLHSLRRPTLFTLDFDFYQRGLCHERHCLECMDVRDDEAASFVRRLLRHPHYDTQAKRMGSVVRVSSVGLRAWQVRAKHEATFGWAYSST